MTINLKTKFGIPLLLTCLALWSSCKKNPVPEPKSNPKKLIIELNKAYMPAAEIDSALVTWEVNGRQKSISLTKSQDTLFAALNQLEPGNGTLNIQLFSRKKYGVHYPSQWVQQQQVEIKQNNDLKIVGPADFNDPNWKPRVELKDNIGHVAVVALRPDDPYFFIKNVPNPLRRLIVTREYWRMGGGIFYAGGGSWECTNNCANSKGHIEDNQYFSFLPAQIGKSTWNHVEIIILYEESRLDGGFILSLTHTF